jgi:hypothetical protein
MYNPKVWGFIDLYVRYGHVGLLFQPFHEGVAGPCLEMVTYYVLLQCRAQELTPLEMEQSNFIMANNCVGLHGKTINTH